MGRKAERAKARLNEAAEQVTAWEQRAQRLTEDLQEVEAAVGAQALASGDLEAAAAGVARLRGQLGVARQTVVAAEAQRDAAQCAAWRAEADDLRAEADDVERQASRHAAKTRALLEQLEKHEGGPYVPDQPQLDINGLPTSSKSFWTPRSRQLAIEAERKHSEAGRLDQQAAQLEQRRDETRQGAPIG
jgi:hypothetical protein